MRTNLLVLILLFISTSSYGSDFIMCPKGRVKVSDSYDVVKSRCGPAYSTQSNGMVVDGVRIESRTLIIRFSDGTKAAFIFVNNKLMNVIAFD